MSYLVYLLHKAIKWLQMNWNIVHKSPLCVLSGFELHNQNVYLLMTADDSSAVTFRDPIDSWWIKSSLVLIVQFQLEMHQIM